MYDYDTTEFLADRLLCMERDERNAKQNQHANVTSGRYTE